MDKDIEILKKLLADGILSEEEFQSEVSKLKEEVRREETRKAAEEKLKIEIEEKARKEAEEKARKEAEEKARKEAEEKARKEAEEKARKEAEEKARKEAEEKARKEAEEKARKEAEEKARKEAEEKARKEAKLRAQEEAKLEVRKEAKAEGKAETKNNPKSKFKIFFLTTFTIAFLGFIYWAITPPEKNIFITKQKTTESLVKYDACVDAISCFEMAEVEKDEIKAQKLWESSCNYEHATGCGKASFFYMDKKPMDFENFKFYMIKACRLRLDWSCYTLAVTYEDKYKDLENAKKYFLKGCDQNHQKSCEALEEINSKDVNRLLNLCVTWHTDSAPLCVSEGEKYEELGNYEIATRFYLRDREKCKINGGACVVGASAGLARVEYKKNNLSKAIELYDKDCKSWHQPSCYMSGIVKIKNNQISSGQKKINYWCNVFTMDVCRIFPKSKRFSNNSEFLKRLTIELSCSEEVGKLKAESCFNHGKYLSQIGDAKNSEQYLDRACKLGLDLACK